MRIFCGGVKKKKPTDIGMMTMTGKVLGFDSYCEEMDRVLETIHQRQSEILGDRNGSRPQRRFLLLFLLVVFYLFMIRGIQGGLGIYDHI